MVDGRRTPRDLDDRADRLHHRVWAQRLPCREPTQRIVFLLVNPVRAVRRVGLPAPGGPAASGVVRVRAWRALASPGTGGGAGNGVGGSDSAILILGFKHRDQEVGTGGYIRITYTPDASIWIGIYREYGRTAPFLPN